MARPEGFEPPTAWFVARYSNPTELRALGMPNYTQRLWSSQYSGEAAALVCRYFPRDLVLLRLVALFLVAAPE